MFRVLFDAYDILSPTCPVRTGVNGVPTLIVEIAGTDRPFFVPAWKVRAKGEIATVNGVPVWCRERNNWLVEDWPDGGGPIPWETLAAAASPIVAEPEVELAIEEGPEGPEINPAGGFDTGDQDDSDEEPVDILGGSEMPTDLAGLKALWDERRPDEMYPVGMTGRVTIKALTEALSK